MELGGEGEGGDDVAAECTVKSVLWGGGGASSLISQPITKMNVYKFEVKIIKTRNTNSKERKKDFRLINLDLVSCQPHFCTALVGSFLTLLKVSCLFLTAARNHVNRMCLAADIPLIESGTAGYLGQVTVIKKVGWTEPH